MFNSCSHIIFISFYTLTFHTKQMLNKPHNRNHWLLHCVIRSLRVFVSTYVLLNKDNNNTNRTTQHGITYNDIVSKVDSYELCISETNIPKKGLQRLSSRKSFWQLSCLIYTTATTTLQGGPMALGVYRDSHLDLYIEKRDRNLSQILYIYETLLRP